VGMIFRISFSSQFVVGLMNAKPVSMDIKNCFMVKSKTSSTRIVKAIKERVE